MLGKQRQTSEIIGAGHGARTRDLLLGKCARDTKLTTSFKTLSREYIKENLVKIHEAFDRECFVFVRLVTHGF